MSYLSFEKLDVPDRKTAVYVVLSTSTERCELGSIKWYAPWRRYTFYTLPDKILDANCLKEITTFIDKLMAERK